MSITSRIGPGIEVWRNPHAARHKLNDPFANDGKPGIGYLPGCAQLQGSLGYIPTGDRRSHRRQLRSAIDQSLHWTLRRREMD